MRITAIIPARLASSRLPEKLVIQVAGKSILQHVYDRVSKSGLFDEVIIATDSQIIQNMCKEFGAPAIMTSPDHQSGTDRVAEAAANLDTDIVVNVQGDEPLVSVAHLQSLVALIKQDGVLIATLGRRFDQVEEVLDPSNVKLVTDLNYKALYFSRHPIPFARDNDIVAQDYLHHIGLYAFKTKTLLELAQLKTTVLEQQEKLEQLRWMENGYTIYTREVKGLTISIDTREDLVKFKSMLED